LAGPAASDPLGGLGDYELRNLTAHLEAAGRADDLHRLLRLEALDPETAEGPRRARNAWFDALERRGDTAAFVADVRRCSSLAQAASMRELAEGGPATSVALEIRYALVSTSFASIATNVPLGLLRALVGRGVWTWRQALAHAEHRPVGRSGRARALAEVASHLAEVGLHDDALRTARTIDDPEWRLRSLEEVAGHAPASLRAGLLGEAVDAARAIDWDIGRDLALERLAPKLAEAGGPDDALATARQIEHAQARSGALAEVAEYLPGPARGRALEDALKAARQVTPDDAVPAALAMVAARLPEPERAAADDEALARAAALEELRLPSAVEGMAPHLAEPRLDEALKLARGAEAPGATVRMLTTLLPYLPADRQRAVLDEALAALRTVHDDKRAVLLAELAPHQARLGDAGAAFAGVQKLTDAFALRIALPALAPYLDEPSLETALAIASRLEDRHYSAQALAGLAPHLPEALLTKGLEAARAIEVEAWRADVLGALAPRLPEPLLRAALEVAATVEDPLELAAALGAFATRLAELGAHDRALATVRAIAVERLRADALGDVAAYLPEPLLDEAFAQLDSFQALDASRALVALLARAALLGRSDLAVDGVRGLEDHAAARALAAVAPNAGPRELGRAFRHARRLSNPVARADAVAAVASHAPVRLVDRALRLLRRVDNEWGDRDRAVAVLLPRVAELGRVDEARRLAAAIEDPQYRAAAYGGIAARLRDRPRREAWDAAFAATREIDDGEEQAQTLAGFAPHLPAGLLADALTLADEIEPTEGRDRRGQAYAALTPYVDAELVDDALAKVRAIQDDRWRAIALAGLSRHGDAILREGLGAAASLDEASWRASSLERLASTVSGLDAEAAHGLWREALAVLARRTREDLLSDLGALSALVARLGGAEAVAGAVDALEDVRRWWP